MIIRFAAVALAIALSAMPLLSPARAAHGADSTTIKIGDLRIENPWARATPGGSKVGGGFLIIHNDGASPDRLIGGSSDIAGRFEIHEMVMQNDIMRMRQLEAGIEIPAGGKIELKPGSYHVMFVQLKSPIVVGTPVKAVLEFERAGKVEVVFEVAPVGAKGFKHDAGHMTGKPEGTAHGSQSGN